MNSNIFFKWRSSGLLENVSDDIGYQLAELYDEIAQLIDGYRIRGREIWMNEADLHIVGLSLIRRWFIQTGNNEWRVLFHNWILFFKDHEVNPNHPSYIDAINDFIEEEKIKFQHNSIYPG